MSYKLDQDRQEERQQLRWVGYTTLMAEIEEELKSLLMRMKEESERVSLRLNYKERKKSRSWHLNPITA